MIEFLVKTIDENKSKLEGFLKLIGIDTENNDYINNFETGLYNQDLGYIKKLTKELGSAIYGKKKLKKFCKEAIIKYILKRAEENKDFFEKFFKEQIFVKKDLEQLSYLESPAEPYGGGLHDYLQAMDKEKLIEISYAIENYLRDGKQLIGGIHDFINSYDEHKLRQHILEQIKEHSELNNIEKIENLLGQKDENKLAEQGFDLTNDVEKHLYTLNHEELSQLAMKLETYHKKESNQEHFLGGIHDYIFKLDDEEIRDYIRKEIKEHEDLNNVDKLIALNN